MKVIAFDIDGALDTDEGLRLYKAVRNENNTIVGIITARRTQSALSFTRNNNTDPAFLRTGPFKGRHMREIRDNFPNADSYIYYGSWFRDRVHSFVSGWEYREL